MTSTDDDAVVLMRRAVESRSGDYVSPRGLYIGVS